MLTVALYISGGQEEAEAKASLWSLFLFSWTCWFESPRFSALQKRWKKLEVVVQTVLWMRRGCFKGSILWDISNAISPPETSKTNRHLLIFVVHTEPKFEQTERHFLQTCFPKTYFAKDWKIPYLLAVNGCASSIQTRCLGPLRIRHSTRWAKIVGDCPQEHLCSLYSLCLEKWENS